MSTPTIELYSALLDLYRYLNKALFEDKLPDVIFTNQRHAKVTGHFAYNRWINNNNQSCHEISINPSYVSKANLIDLMQTLTHEMCHCWQYEFGKKQKQPGYHNHQWAEKMIELGLKPTDDGTKDGNIVGFKMYDYPIPGGKFLNVCQELLQQQNFEMPWLDIQVRRNQIDKLIEDDEINPVDVITAEVIADSINDENIKEQLCTPLAAYIGEENFEEMESKSNRRTKYTCVGCKINLWGKKNLLIRCENCNLQLVANYTEPKPEKSAIGE